MPSDEPNKNMDDLLRAYAKKRREQANPALEIHPATRKLLQGEVRRTWGSKPKQARLNRPLFGWPLGAFGGAFAVLLLLFIVFHSPTPNSLPPLAPPERNLSRSKTSDRLDGLNADKKVLPENVGAPNLPGQRAPSGEVGAATERSMTHSAGRGGGLHDATPLVNGGTILSATSGGIPPAAYDASNAAGGEFAQVHDGTPASMADSPPSNILSSFQVLRNGQSVRVVDSDGSVYEGQVLGANAGEGAVLADFARQSKDKRQDANAGYAFKVAGTNRFVQQNVVFTGNISNLPLAAMASHMAAQYQKAPQGQTQNAVSNGLVQNAQNQYSRITGKVQVGSGKEFKIEAQSPAP